MKTNAILLPIHSKYSQLILSGEKYVEVRRGNIPSHINLVFIYETAPTKRVVGFFKVGRIVERNKYNAFALFGEKMKIESKDYLKYLEGKEKAQLIFIEKIYKFDNPFGLIESAPQSFKYLNAGTQLDFVQRGS